MAQWIQKVQWFNTLVIGSGLVVLLLLLTWGGVVSIKDAMQLTTKSVQVPQAEGQAKTDKDHYFLRPTDLNPQAGGAVFKLLSHRQGVGYEDARSSEIRNLLFFNGTSETSIWLYPDQSQVLNRIERFDENKAEGALFIEWETVQQKSPDRNAAKLLQIDLVKLDGKGLQRALTDVEQVLRQRQTGQELEVIYQVKDAVRLAKFSIKDFRKLSDTEVARVEAR